MKKNYITKVIKQFFGQEYPVDTSNRVQQWLIAEENKEEKEKVLYELWENESTEVSKEAREALDQLKNHLGMKQKEKRRFLFPLKRVRAASVLLLLLLLSGSIYYFYLYDTTMEYTAMNGEIKRIDLPDGSKVWLNAGSSLSYQESNRAKNRKLKLSGEACFKVVTDSIKPFIITTNTLSVEVLGTEFNIEAYPENSKVVTTLHTGKIKVGIPDNKQKNGFYYLEPNQQLIYDPSSGVEIRQVHSEEVQSWKEGNLIFSYTLFPDIIRKLERHFNVKIRIYNFEDNYDYYSVKFINDESLEQIMKVLEGLVGNFTYEITN